MELPNEYKVVINFRKILDYLLSEFHPIGKFKARYFHSIGFTKINADLLRQGLLDIAYTGEIKEIIKSPYGMKYVIEGNLKTPSGFSVKIKTIWIIEKGDNTLRFITAYPA